MATLTQTPVAGTVSRLYDGYIFDLDGTLYLGDELLPGAATPSTSRAG